jgi:hypothetical protein
MANYLFLSRLKCLKGIGLGLALSYYRLTIASMDLREIGRQIIFFVQGFDEKECPELTSF